MENNNSLNIGSELQGGKYRIIKVLGQGGFGITYEAEQVLLKRKVAIKEFFMKDCCEREESTSQVYIGTGTQRNLVSKFRTKFLREAQMIAAMDHPHIVRVLDVFEENGTAYYVMENLPGGDIGSLVKSNGPLSEDMAEHYTKQVAEALSYIHSMNTVHLDVKPSNILLNAKGVAVLIDFGISKHYDDSGQQTSSTPVGISKGFAPLEQGRDGDVSQFKPSTDIYSLGATLYYMVTGLVPPEASIVIEEGLDRPGRVSDRIWKVISKSMQHRRKDRPQSISEFLQLFENTPQKEPKQDKQVNINEEQETIIVDQKSGSEKSARNNSSGGFIAVKELVLSSSSLTLKKGEYRRIDVSFKPENASDKNVKWKSSDIQVASVDREGFVKAVGQGHAQISATCGNVGVGSTCAVSVFEDADSEAKKAISKKRDNVLLKRFVISIIAFVVVVLGIFLFKSSRNKESEVAKGRYDHFASGLSVSYEKIKNMDPGTIGLEDLQAIKASLDSMQYYADRLPSVYNDYTQWSNTINPILKEAADNLAKVAKNESDKGLAEYFYTSSLSIWQNDDVERELNKLQNK